MIYPTGGHTPTEARVLITIESRKHRGRHAFNAINPPSPQTH